LIAPENLIECSGALRREHGELAVAGRDTAVPRADKPDF